MTKSTQLRLVCLRGDQVNGATVLLSLIVSLVLTYAIPKIIPKIQVKIRCDNILIILL
jgi:hypothetical protein